MQTQYIYIYYYMLSEDGTETQKHVGEFVI